MSAQQSITVTVLDVNEPPVIPARSTFDVDENTTGVGTVVASDMDDGDEVTSYEITDGADRSRFSIGRTTGALVFNAAPNFESPADLASSDPVNAGGNNEYLLVVTAKSGSGAREMSAQQSITVTVLDVNEPPVIPATSTFDVDENTTGVGTVVASDADDGVTSYEITDGADRSRFSIGRTTGALVFNAAPNFESPADVASSDPVNAGGNNEYLLVVTAKSGSGAREMSAQQSITVTVLDVNEPPVIPATSTFDVDENTTGVGTVVASDMDDRGRGHQLRDNGWRRPVEVFHRANHGRAGVQRRAEFRKSGRCVEQRSRERRRQQRVPAGGDREERFRRARNECAAVDHRDRAGCERATGDTRDVNI